MKANKDVDEKRVADVTKCLPFARDEVNIITSRFVLEHLEDVEKFVSLSSRVVKQHGYCIHLFPSKFAPFALLNQLLPASVSRSKLLSIYPDKRGGRGFVAYYDRCYYAALNRVFVKHGFRIVGARFSYYQSYYFAFFVPLFMLSCVYEIFLKALKAKNLSPYVIVVAQKT
jgi:ubiquinone/menaquinone biosynthesis C-methylase UbiE